MMVTLFALTLLSLILAWFKHRTIAITFYLILLGLSIIWFIHHASDKLNLNL